MREYVSTSRFAVKDPMLSSEDAELRQWNWRLHKSGYVIRGPVGRPGQKRTIWLHREVMARALGRLLLPTEFVDHVNGDKADNRRHNLRLATRTENMYNRGAHADGRSGYVGVSWEKRRSYWLAVITANKTRIQIGGFRNEAEAAWMYDQWALELHGDYARLNFEYIEVSR